MIINCFEPAWQCRGKTVYKWGKDSTGLIEYQFNNQGFRSSLDYTTAPDYAFFGNSSVFGIGAPVDKNLTSFFINSHNYGLAGSYMNWHSVENLKRFVASPFCTDHTKIIFVWSERPGKEFIPDLIGQVNLIRPKVLHISMGDKYSGAVNLMPSVDHDISGTHPGPKSHQIWAKTIQLLLQK